MSEELFPDSARPRGGAGAGDQGLRPPPRPGGLPMAPETRLTVAKARFWEALADAVPVLRDLVVAALRDEP